MRQSIAVFTGIVLLLCTVQASGAGVQRTFVASTGLDTNPCSRSMPCRGFAAAIAQTSPNGEVVAIDSAGYGQVTIGQSVTIVAPLGVHAGISVFSGDGVTVNAGNLVVLRNLFINSQGGANGITLNSAGTIALYVEHCVVSGFSQNDINLVPTEPATVAISDTIARLSSSGIYADSAQPLTVSIDRCRFDRNSYGVLADRATVAIGNSVSDGNTSAGFDARGTGGVASMIVEDSVMSNNAISIATAGLEVDTNGRASVHNSAAFGNYVNYANAGGRLSLDHCIATGGTFGVTTQLGGDTTVTACTIGDNSSDGAGASGSGSFLRLIGNTITRNGVGVHNYGGGAAIWSTGDNTVNGNSLDTSGTIGTFAKL